jgi:perosamine synthetase
VDIRPDTWCIDPNKVKGAVTSRTKAIVATHIYGNLCDMDVLLEIGEKYGIPIIEDAAEGIGSRYKEKYAGSMGGFGVFSFHGTKTLTTGEGGMFVTDDEYLYEKVLTASHHGRSRYEQKQFWPESVGFKYRMSNIQAAIGCAQLSRVESLVARKREILERYRHHLEDPPGVGLNPEPASGVNGAWMPTIIFSRSANVTAEDLQKALLQCDIDARVFFSPLSSLPMFTNKPGNENAYDIPSRALNLPSYHDMSFQEQHAVIEVVQGVIRHSRRVS